MAKLIYAALASLDGYIADADGNFDWAEPGDEVHAFVNDLERPVGTYLYGRRMYETMPSRAVSDWSSSCSTSVASPTAWCTCTTGRRWKADDLGHLLVVGGAGSIPAQYAPATISSHRVRRGP